MGHSTALEYAELVSEGLNLAIALSFHFSSNHYPPLPESLIPVAIKAIEAINEDESDRELELPEGISWKGKTSAPAIECARAWHLDAFIEEGEY